MILLLLLAQAATVSSAPEVTSWSILEPIGNEPCRRAASMGTEENDGGAGDVVVCAKPLPSQKLPYPDEVILNRPRPSNPELRATGALAAESSPCATESRGCAVGFGPPIMPLVVGAIDAAKSLFATKPDKTGRVAIPLDDPPPPPSVILP